MRRGAWLLFAAALALTVHAQRGVRLAPRQTPAIESFDRAQSAALFVGVRKFANDDIQEVPYAADDAVDLAYTFALAPNVGLVPAGRVVLVLSGRPQKKLSQDRLALLKRAGAVVEYRATMANVFAQLKKQASRADKDGMLIVAFATHGFSREDGEPRVLTSESMTDFPEMTLSIARILDATSRSKARRSVVFFDACRERVTGSRALERDPRSAAPLLEAMKRIAGQVVFFAAPHGGYTGDDASRQNGVFTGAIVDALQCNATSDPRGFVTVETLRDYVNAQVLAWVHHRDPDATSAIQVRFDGDTLKMPLATCSNGPTRPPSPAPHSAEPIATIARADTNVAASSAAGRELWRRDMRDPLVEAAVVDGVAVIACKRSISVIDGTGALQWSLDLSADDMRIEKLLPRRLFRKASHELVVLCRNATSSRVLVLDMDRTVLGIYNERRLLNDITVDRVTARHGNKIIGFSDTAVVVLDAKRVQPVWCGNTAESILRVATVDFDNDGRRDLAITTDSEATVHVDFEGRVLPSKGSHPSFELSECGAGAAALRARAEPKP